jgi:hypothetical protein
VSQPLEVRSFRSVFALERRIYRIDTLRLNPTGIPLRGVGYAVALVAAALIASALPPTAWLDPAVPWYVRELGGPLAIATLLATVRIEGRPFHLAALALLRLAVTPRCLTGLTPTRRCERWRPPEILCIPNGSDSQFRSLRYRGPGAVLVNHPHLRSEWSGLTARADITLHPLAQTGTRPTVLELADRAVLEARRA